MTATPVDAPRVDLPRQLARQLLPAAVAVAVLIGVVAPALIWYFQVEAARANAMIYARDFERHLQAFVLENGPLWRYQAQKYVETLRRFVPDKDIRFIGVTDERNELMPLLQYVAEPVRALPNVPVRVSVPVRFNNRVVANVVLEVSTARATASALRLFAVLGATGGVFGLFMFALPVSVARRLDRRVQAEMRARTDLYLAAQRHLAQTRDLTIVVGELAGTLDPQEAADRAVAGAARLFATREARLWRIDHQAAQVPVVAVGAAASDADMTRVAAALATSTTRREPADGGGERWLIPLVVGAHCAGALELTTAHVADEAEAELLGLFAGKVGIALVNGELHDGIRRALAQVTIQNAELDSFVHTVSHDLKAPLVAIRGFATALEEAVPPDAGGDIAHYARRIGTNVEHMSNLLRDMLELSRVTRPTEVAAAVAIDPIVQEILADLQDAIETRGVQVSVGELGELWGARSALLSVFQNLIGNAVKYLGDTPHPRVEIGRRWCDGVPEYFVRDNGIGIDPVYHDKVFGLFERLHDVKTAGTGVGLAIVRRIVERAGGRVRVDSARGRGATFSFTWPRPAAASSFVSDPIGR